MGMSPPNYLARFVVVILLAAGSSWGIHRLGLAWLWSVPLGVAAGIVEYYILIALGGSRGCCDHPGPRDPRDPSA